MWIKVFFTLLVIITFEQTANSGLPDGVIGFTEDCELVSWNEEGQSESFSCANGCTRTVYLDYNADFWWCPSTVEGYLVAHYDGGLVWAGRRCRQDSECGTSGNYICNTSGNISGIDFAYSCKIAAQCVSGYYRSTHKDNSSREICVPCPDGYFCTQNQKQECPDGYTAMAGAGAISDCCKSCTRACTQQSCPSNATCTHGSTSTTGTICYGGSCNAAASTCSITATCNAGYYLSNGSCVKCEAGYYCPGDNSRYACTNKPSNSSYTGTASSNSCPWSCNSGYNLTSDNQCGQFCGSGITHIHLSTGLKIPLYATARTAPAINVKWNDTICYGSLVSGSGTGLNVNYNGTTYHAVK